MNKAEKAVIELRAMDELAAQNSPVHRMSPLAKLAIAVLYVLVTVSFHKYDITGLFVMILFPLTGYAVSGISVAQCFRKLRIVMPLVCAVGLFNPIFDHTPLFQLGSITVSGGFISMLTLMMKGVFCLMASFLLIATTRIEAICGALRAIHVPAMITSLILLTFRYVSILLEEVSIMTDAYMLRAPSQKGINVKAWGSFLGQLILRSSDRAERLHESMLLRGFTGEFDYSNEGKSSVLTVFIICLLIMLARSINFSALIYICMERIMF
ncbi:MAG: energy-coupling factor transporter transmembrane component T [Firmicutes bacterium]|nr:energy-coupling factor transporter transmembrane component T [Bacillota bacterium]